MLPRLWRDAIVFESWEGTHNVLCAQVARDLERFGTLELVLARSRGVDPRIDAALDSLRERMAGSTPCTSAASSTSSCEPYRRPRSSARRRRRPNCTSAVTSSRATTRSAIPSTQSFWTALSPLEPAYARRRRRSGTLAQLRGRRRPWRSDVVPSRHSARVAQLHARSRSRDQGPRGPSCRARALTTGPASAIVMSVSAQSCWSTASTPSWPPTASP